MSLPSNASRHRFTTGITRKTWLSTVEDTDRIAVRNLSSTPNSGYDVWGRKKRQPALLSLTVYLKHTFDQAARSDSVDTSTVHYGILSKKVLAVIEKYSEWQLTYHLAREILSGAYLVAGANSLKGCELDLFYPKACMQGDGAGLIFSTTDHGFFNTLYLKNVRISCLIGVNSNERLAKQPVIANLWIESIRKEQCDEYGAAEKILIETIESSSFETLESLATTVVADLRKQLFPVDEGANIRLRLEKPMAVPFADAPAIEIYRAASHGT